MLCRISNESTKCISAPSVSSAIWYFEGSDAIEIRNGITFDFYAGLPHMSPVLNQYSASNLVMQLKYLMK